MRKTQPMSIGELWSDFLRSSPRVARSIAEARAVSGWNAIAGQAIASCTVSLRLDKGILHVGMNSSVARNEVFLHREELRRALNNSVGQEVIRSIIVR